LNVKFTDCEKFYDVKIASRRIFKTKISIHRHSRRPEWPVAVAGKCNFTPLSNSQLLPKYNYSG